MRFALPALITYIISRFRPDESLRLENLALRHQLLVYQRTVNRPKLRPSDRFFLGLAIPSVAGLETGFGVCSASNRPRVAEEAVPRLLATLESEWQARSSPDFQRSPGVDPRYVAI